MPQQNEECLAPGVCVLHKQVTCCDLPGVLLSSPATGIQWVVSPLLLTAGMVIFPDIPELVISQWNYCCHKPLLCVLCHPMAEYMDKVLGFGMLVRFFLDWDYELLSMFSVQQFILFLIAVVRHSL